MIMVIRRCLQGPVFKAIIWVTILAIAGIFSIPAFLRNTGTGGVWALRVNGEEISFNEYRQHVHDKQAQIANFRAQYGQYADLLFASMGVNLDPHKLAFDELVKEELIHQIATNLDIHIHPDYITTMLRDANFLRSELGDLIPPSMITESGLVDQHALKMYIKRMGLSVEEFEHRIERALTRNIITTLVKSALYVPEFDINYQQSQQNVSKKFSYLIFPFDTFLQKAKKETVTAEELKAFYDKQNAFNQQYWVPEKRNVQVWQFEAPSYNIEISSDQIEQYYEKNKTKLFVAEPTKIQVRRILIKVDDENQRAEKNAYAMKVREQVLQKPQEFSNFVQQYSDDKGGNKDGLLPLFAKGEHEASFERAAFILQNDGDISDVVETKEGFQILQRVIKKAATYKPLQTVSNEIQHILRERKFANLFINDTKSLIQNGLVDPKALTSFITLKSGKLNTFNALSKDHTKLAQTVFKLKENEYVSYVDGKIGFIAQVIGIEKRHLPEFESIKEKILEDLYQERASQEIEKQLNLAYQSPTKSLKDLQSEFGVQLKTTDILKEHDEKSLESLRKQGLPTVQMMMLEKKGSRIKVMDKNGYLVNLDDTHVIIADDKDSMESDDASQHIEPQRKGIFIEGFVASLYRNAKIETNEQVLLTLS